MKTIILITVYSIACLALIIYLEPVYAIIGVTGLSILFLCWIVKNMHPNHRYIAQYIRLRNLLIERKKLRLSGFICIIVKNNAFPNWFVKDVLKRLSELSDTHPHLTDDQVMQGRHSSQVIEKRLSMWFLYDYDPRFEFIDTIISELKQEIDDDSRLGR